MTKPAVVKGEGPRKGYLNVLPEDLAREFHRWYELLARSYGYVTRAESAVHWEELPEQNRELMLSTARHVIESMDLCRIGIPPVYAEHWRKRQARKRKI